MKQVVQNLRSGVLELLDVPCPRVSAGHLLIQTRATVISAGTERMLVEFGRAGMVSKARQQPEKVRQVIDKIKTDGLLPTLEAVLFKLDEPLPLGYCNAGMVVEVGAGVRRFAVGDRVVSNGPHAEMVHRPENSVREDSRQCERRSSAVRHSGRDRLARHSAIACWNSAKAWRCSDWD